MQGINIEGILKSHEGKTLEYKENSDAHHNILRTIVAFANTAGGRLVIGIRDKDRSVVGVTSPLLEEEKLANLIDDGVHPKIVPSIEILSYRNKTLIVLEVFPGPSKPYFLKKLGSEKGVFFRVGSTNREADQDIIQELKRSVNHQYFDESPMPNLNPEAIDFRVASGFFSAKRKLTKNDLETLGLVVSYQGKKVPSVGGVILFSPAREKYFPDCWLQAGCFRGTDKNEIIDSREIHDYPLEAIEKGLEFVKKFSLMSYKITGAKRKENWSIPLDGLREALINAYAHMDYSQKGAPIRLSIFEDRVEIENPGLLPFGLTINDILEGISKVRNKVIVRVMHELEYVEKWGSGIQRILASCRNAGLPDPEFREISTRFRVTLHTIPSRAPKLDKIDSQIIDCIQNSSGLKTTQVALKVNISARAARERLKRLLELKLIVEIGTGPFDPNKKYMVSP
jgi:predicted HTH transcriptional regulator